MENIGISECSVCGKKKECVFIKISWFTRVKLCETCVSKMFRLFRKDR